MSDETTSQRNDYRRRLGCGYVRANLSRRRLGCRMAEQATVAPSQPAEPAKPHAFEQLGPGGSSATQNDLDMILDIPVQLTVELGRTKMPIKNLLQLAQGSVVELAGMAG